MPEPREWMEVTLDTGSRRGLADSVEATSGDNGSERKALLLRMLRSSRNELLLDKEQAQLVLNALNVDRRMSALRARCEAFLGER
jgi:hypothetical protein